MYNYILTVIVEGYIGIDGSAKIMVEIRHATIITCIKDVGRVTNVFHHPLSCCMYTALVSGSTSFNILFVLLGYRCLPTIIPCFRLYIALPSLRPSTFYIFTGL